MTTSELSGELRQTITAASQRLRWMAEPGLAAKPAADKWSKKEILGHLIDSAANNHQRFVRAQLESELRFPGYEQEGWARCQNYAQADWNSLITLWQAYNKHLAYILDQIPVEKLATPCWIGKNEPVTLGFLIQDYLKHMKHHLSQLERS